MQRNIIFAFCCFFILSCRPATYTPKPAGYFKIDLPEKHTYQTFNEPGYPYTFEYPTYAKIEKDTVYFGEKPENPYWINIQFPSIRGTIYISYKEISPKQSFAKLLDDAHKLSFFHTKKADDINEYNLTNKYGVAYIVYDVGGDAASAYQFVATDSVKNFIRGALYFNVTPNADSLKPANEFLRTDIDHLLRTIRWK